MRKFLRVAGILLLVMSCSTPLKPTSPSDAQVDPIPLIKPDSQVDIRYSLGHDHYFLVASAKGGEARAHFSLDKRVVHESPVDYLQYEQYLKRASGVVESLQKTPIQISSSCRSPFTITILIGNHTQTAQGCRSNDHGSLSRLVKEGEFLLYSKN